MRALALALLVACSETKSDPPTPYQPTTVDAAATRTPDAPVDASKPSTVFASTRLGDPNDDTRVPTGPGLILSSSDMAVEFAWARDQIGGTDRAGDVVVLSASDSSTEAQFIYDHAQFRSVQNVVVPKTPGSTDIAAALVDKAEFVWISGGDQSNYVTAWRRTSLATAISNVWKRGGVVGGASAGTLVLGEYVYDATVTGVSETVTPAVALADPFDPKISFTRDMLAFPPLAGAITEVHFEAIDRMGRIVSFMARQHADGVVTRTPREVLGIAVSDGAAIAIDRTNQGRLLREDGKARAFVIKGGPTPVAPGQRLAYPGLTVWRFDDDVQRFDFRTDRWCGDLPRYTLDVAADAGNPYGSGSPYDRPGTASPCPAF